MKKSFQMIYKILNLIIYLMLVILFFATLIQSKWQISLALLVIGVLMLLADYDRAQYDSNRKFFYALFFKTNIINPQTTLAGLALKLFVVYSFVQLVLGKPFW